MQRAAIYIRVSTVEQTTNLSLPTQKARCIEYCERQGLQVDRIFTEEGESAKTADRTQLRKLIEYISNGKSNIAVVVVYRLDRFARRAEDHFAIRALLRSYGVTLRSVSENIDETPAGAFMEGALSLIAQYDNDVRAVRTVDGMRASLRKGIWTFKARSPRDSRHRYRRHSAECSSSAFSMRPATTHGEPSTNGRGQSPSSAS